jgi:hypothetical protein
LVSQIVYFLPLSPKFLLLSTKSFILFGRPTVLPVYLRSQYCSTKSTCCRADSYTSSCMPSFVSDDRAKASPQSCSC